MATVPQRLLIVEPYSGGHYDTYMHALAQSLIGMSAVQSLPEIVLAVQEGRDSQWRSVMPSAVTVAGCLPGLTLALTDRLRVSRATSAAVDRFAPDTLLCMSADAEFPLQDLFARHRPRHTIGVFHFGHPPDPGRHPRRMLLQALVYGPNWRSRTWSTAMFVNPLLYRYVKSLRFARRRDIRLLPDPVNRPRAVERSEARRRLGLPGDANILGMLGTVDRRKAVIELIRGFQSANVPNGTVLAIAGAVIQNHSEADIAAAAGPLLASGRVIFRPSFLSPEELDLWYAAVDATAPLYFDTPSLSANLLRSLAFHRPVLVNRFGYSGMVVDRFSVGVSCSVRDLSSVAAAVEAIWKFRSPRFEPDVSRLLAFHDPQNFCRAIWEATGVLPTGTSLANVYEDEGPATGGLSHFP